MPLDWREYLGLARDLIGQAGAGYSSEGAERSAVSRAYYAAFCWVRNYVKHRRGVISTKKANDHKLLREHLRKLGMTRLASLLNELRLWRNKCDYDDDVANLGRYVWNAINIAEKAIQQCR